MHFCLYSRSIFQGFVCCLTAAGIFRGIRVGVLRLDYWYSDYLMDPSSSDPAEQN